MESGVKFFFQRSWFQVDRRLAQLLKVAGEVGCVVEELGLELGFDGYQLLLLAGCFENFRVLSYVFIV